jgi:hypothetical protein
MAEHNLTEELNLACTKLVKTFGAGPITRRLEQGQLNEVN